MVAIPRPIPDAAPVTALRKTALVLGAGYGGLTAALRLARRLRKRDDWQVVLVDRNPYHLLETRLHEAAARGAEVTIPLARIIRKTGIRLQLATITGIDLEANEVHTDRGSVRYDVLILAFGSVTNFYGIPGLAEDALELKTLADAQAIQQRMARQFALAAGHHDEADRRALLRLVVGGAGLTGVELAAELAETADRLARLHEIDRNEVEILLLDAGPTILPTVDPVLRRRAEADLLAKRIAIHTNTKVAGLDGATLLLEPGGPLHTGLFVWTGGVRVPDLMIGMKPEEGPQGRLLVEPVLRLKGHQNVFAVGDLALATNPESGAVVPAAAQFALQQGRLAGDNAANWIEGVPLRVYQPHVMGEVVSLGRHLAVGWVALGWPKRLKLAGFVASLIKRAIAERHLLLLWRESHNRAFAER